MAVSYDPNDYGRRMHGLNFRERKSFSVLVTGFTRASPRPSIQPPPSVNDTEQEDDSHPNEEEIENEMSLVDEMFDLTEQEKHRLHTSGEHFCAIYTIYFKSCTKKVKTAEGAFLNAHAHLRLIVDC